MRKQVNFALILKKCPDMIRELEMCVDSISFATEQGFGIQFWIDVKLYNVKSALLSLQSYVVGFYKIRQATSIPDEIKLDLERVEQKVEEIIRMASAD